MRNKKTITIGFIVLILIIIILLLTRCSNSVETQNTSIKTDKTTEKAKKKTTTKKIESTSSQKTEVKQEEKKEETAKADSSNKSNASESKKDTTTSTTNTSSNKNNTGSSKPSSSSKPSNNSGSNSSNSKPAEHTHNWVAQYKTVNVPEKGHNEQVLVQAAYDEQVPITEMKAYSICNQCGADITGFAVSHNEQHLANYEPGGYHTEWRETITGYNTVHHDAVYETRYVVDSPATTKQELTGYKCSSCGKTKAN